MRCRLERFYKIFKRTHGLSLGAQLWLKLLVAAFEPGLGVLCCIVRHKTPYRGVMKKGAA